MGEIIGGSIMHFYYTKITPKLHESNIYNNLEIKLLFRLIFSCINVILPIKGLMLKKTFVYIYRIRFNEKKPYKLRVDIVFFF